ncbi:hypothetical protein DRJ04_08100 [Candidatus Aerophobetes bacterium]|uniref:Polysaccharide chain length determinant N-terminal domain-containing protein n=1 Tax=Aerophobetes bacterium TaxID=2030807 RepID=A0A662DBM4_UNCAE|nr:MAG: hypothetical protein DRJ04_08100 [Candidatus Aerophobetes bacterium]
MIKDEAEFEEIDLRDYLEVLFKRKYIVLGIFFISIITAATVSFFGLSPVYRSTARVIVAPPSVGEVSEFKSYEEFLNFQAVFPGFYSPQTYVELLKNPSLEKEVIRLSGLEEKTKEDFSPEDLEKISSIQLVKGTRVIQITIEYKDPVLAKDIANTWARLFTEKIKNERLQRYLTVKTSLESRLNLTREKLSEIEKEKREFDKEDKIDLMEKEIQEKSLKLRKDRTRIFELQSLIQVEKAKIEELEKHLKEEKQVIVLTESIADHPVLRRLISRIEGEIPSNLQVKSEHINPLYQKIKTDLTRSKVNLIAYQQELTYLQKEVKDLTGKIEKLRKELAEKRPTYERITRELTLARKNYDSLSSQAELVSWVEPLLEEEAKIASLAAVPDTPFKPKKVQNIAISAVLGLFVGVIAAFFAEWWSKGKVEIEKNGEKSSS